MKSNSTFLDKLRSIWPFNRVETPLFLRIEPITIKSVADASQPFLSLVDFVKDGNKLDDRKTKQACSLLQRITPQSNFASMAETVLYQLVPQSPWSCSGFTNSMIPLLRSPNMEIVKSSLQLLERVVSFAMPTTRFDFIQSGFFSLLPSTFYEQNFHLVSEYDFSLIEIVKAILADEHRDLVREISGKRYYPTGFVNRTFMYKFFRPIEPFLEFIYINQRRLAVSSESDHFALIFARLIECSPFLEEMSQCMMRQINAWLFTHPAVRTRGKKILLKLCEEGLSDEVELHVHDVGVSQEYSLSLREHS